MEELDLDELIQKAFLEWLASVSDVTGGDPV